MYPYVSKPSIHSFRYFLKISVTNRYKAFVLVIIPYTGSYNGLYIIHIVLSTRNYKHSGEY